MTTSFLKFLRVLGLLVPLIPDNSLEVRCLDVYFFSKITICKFLLSFAKTLLKIRFLEKIDVFRPDLNLEILKGQAKWMQTCSERKNFSAKLEAVKQVMREQLSKIIRAIYFEIVIRDN